MQINGENHQATHEQSLETQHLVFKQATSGRSTSLNGLQWLDQGLQVE